MVFRCECGLLKGCSAFICVSVSLHLVCSGLSFSFISQWTCWFLLASHRASLIGDKHYWLLTSGQTAVSGEYLSGQFVHVINLHCLAAWWMAGKTSVCICWLRLLARWPECQAGGRQTGVTVLCPFTTSQLRLWHFDFGVSHIFGLNSMIGKHPLSHFLFFMPVAWLQGCRCPESVYGFGPDWNT